MFSPNPVKRAPQRCARRWAAGAVMALSSLALPAHAAASGPALKSIKAVATGDHVQITLSLDAAAPKVSSFAIKSPPRLSVDLPGTSVALDKPYRTLDVGPLRSYAAVAAGGRTRVVFDLTQSVPYTVTTQGDDVIVDLGGASAAEIPGTSEQPAASLTSVDFRRGDRGAGRVIIGLSDPSVSPDVSQEGGRIVAVFHNTTVPGKLAKRLDVIDFATPVKYVDTEQDGRDARVALTPISGAFEQVSYQSGNQFVVELQPLTQQQEEQRKAEHPQFTGKRISLNFQNVDVRSLLQIIADVAGTNMVVSDSVKGQIAIRLQNVPWDQALDIILRTKGLGMHRQGNVMFVAPLQELAQREKVELQAQQQKTQLEPLHSEIIQVNYAKASDIAAILKSGDNSILSQRGRVTVDERTNTLLVLDTLDKLADVRKLVQRLDVPVRQVLIESRIVIASNTFDKQIGTRFGFTGFTQNNAGNVFSTSGTSTSTNSINNSFTSPTFTTLPNGQTYQNINFGNQTDTYNVNLPVANPAGSLALSILGSNFLVDLELSALQAEGKGEVVSSPRVITANAKQASIEQGVEIPYQQSTSSGATSVQFKKAVLSLNVTPQITPDNRIIMDLAINKDSVGQNVSTGNGGSVPSIDTRKINTQVLVDNGQTVVLGGIYEQTKNHTVKKVPLLGDLPLLGHLFRYNEDQNNRDELLIFITPKILNEGLKVGD